MKVKALNIFILQILEIVLLSAISYSFNVDYDCLYDEEGATILFDVSPQIDFYIPHNWVNNDDRLNYLNIRAINKNVTLRHPFSSRKEPNEIEIPLKEMKIGWNTIYLKKDGINLQVEVFKENSRKVILNVVLFKGLYFLVGRRSYRVSGLYSLVNCLNVHQTRYFIIAARSNVTVPFILRQRPNKFQAFSEIYPFKFEIYCSGSRRKVCKNDEKSINSFTIRRKCEFEHVTTFSEDIINNVYVSSDAFDSKDILNYNNSIFTELLLHNIGDTDFFIQIDVWPPSNAPISLLLEEDYERTLSTEDPTSVISSSNKATDPTVFRSSPRITSTLNPFSNDTIVITPNSNEGKYALAWIILACVFGILLLIIIIAFIQLYVKYYYTRMSILDHDARVDQEFFPFTEGLHGYVVGIPTPRVSTCAPLPDSNTPGELKQKCTERSVSTGSVPPDPNTPEVLDQERPEDNFYEEYHYYERYHPKMDQEENPKYENTESHGKNETQYVNI